MASCIRIAFVLCCAAPCFAGATVYEAFNQRCREHFGAEKEEEVYRAFGAKLAVVEGSRWQHVSESSACFAWQTNLPALSWVEYGPTDAYGRRTDAPERLFSTHLHHVTGLKPGVPCHYRLVAVDERGRRLATDDATFTPRAMPDAIRVPGQLDGPPYVLDRANATYLVTRDIVADGTAVFIAAPGVTLDLGGHAVTYDNRTDRANEGACGVRGHKSRGIGLNGVAVLNGTIRPGAGGSGTQKVWDTLYNPLFFSRPSGLELAGLRVSYGGPQVVAVLLLIRGERCNVHHNTLADTGTHLFNRHTGLDVVAFGASNSACHHNLIRRTRHRGIKAGSQTRIHDNEIYVDSYATNSYGVMYYGKGGSDVLIARNRIFGTGYHPVGIGSGQGWLGARIEGNYIQMQALAGDDRWRGGQGGGDDPNQIHPVNGIRLQRPAGDIVLADNTIVVRGRGEGAMMRGLWLVPSGDSNGLALRNNRVKLVAEDGQAEGYAISAGGTDPPGQSALVPLEGNTAITNLCHVQFGDNYSHGGRYAFLGSRFVRIGDDPRYRTVRLGWRGWKYETYGHAFYDTALDGGASFESVSFDGTRRGRYDFAVGWTLTIEAKADAPVTIREKAGKEVHSGRTGDDGKLTVPVTAFVKTREGRVAHTPHSVTVGAGAGATTKSVTMDGPQRLRF